MSQIKAKLTLSEARVKGLLEIIKKAAVFAEHGGQCICGAPDCYTCVNDNKARWEIKSLVEQALASTGKEQLEKDLDEVKLLMNATCTGWVSPYHLNEARDLLKNKHDSIKEALKGLK